MLDDYCARTGSSRSEVIRDALDRHLRSAQRTKRPNLYDLAADIIPPGGIPERQSADVTRIMSEHWRAKRVA